MSLINSTQTKRQIPKKEFDDNWDKVFGKTKAEKFIATKEEYKLGDCKKQECRGYSKKLNHEFCRECLKVLEDE